MTSADAAPGWIVTPAPPLPAPVEPGGMELPTPSTPRDQPSPPTALFLLSVSLLGFLGVALLLYQLKFHGQTAYLYHVPTRDLFVFFLALVTAPFLLTVFRRVPVLFLLAPAVLIFFLYPLFSPFGLPFSRDPIFNFQFAQSIVSSGTWNPAVGVTGQAGTYSYFPGGAIYSSEVSSLTSLSLLQTFNWGVFLFRLLVVPLAIYAMAARLFSVRSAPLAVLIYLGIPSIEFNIPTQQDFAIIWFILALMVLAFLATSKRPSTFLQLALIAFCTAVIVSHHVSTYILLGWLGSLAILPWILKRRDPYPNARSAIVFLRTLATTFLWVILVTLPVVIYQTGILQANIASVLHPAAKSLGAVGAIRGSTFTLYQTGWIVLGIALIVALALLTMVESYREESRAFSTFSIFTGLLLIALSLPFLSTGFSFLALRIMEYAGVVLAPAAAFWLVERVAWGQIFPRRRYSRSTYRRHSRVSVRRRRVGGALVVVIAILVFTGGSLVPLSTRDQFASPSGVLIDSPMFINSSAYQAVQWASAHMNRSEVIWGDYLAYSSFGAFGGFTIHFNSYPLFNGTLFNETLIADKSFHVGSYVVTDIYLTRQFIQPEFDGPSNSQPSAPLTQAELNKFYNPLFFSIIYSNSVFTIVKTINVPTAAYLAS
jgi:hypothetical protein